MSKIIQRMFKKVSKLLNFMTYVWTHIDKCIQISTHVLNILFEITEREHTLLHGKTHELI